jgi:hypothetical protein
MIFHVGYQTFEIRPGLESLIDKETLYFDSRDDALKWLKRLGFLQSNLIVRLRDFVARYCNDWETHRVTNDYLLERLATLLYLRRVVVTSREFRTSGGSPTPTTQAPPPPFPLSERTSRDPSSSTAAHESDSSVFDPNSDGSAQAAALVSAAADGTPFCSECTKS